ncbi:MAG: N utilization substance protein B-like protein [candidate division Zixibacteria bacterium RBG-1]|nr:MAG: N utilization substance protein B-like protein [candidate division Zixibacteria bacterium RBG-1]OGC86743.1 MAG: transcription antitermination factor NusB [candidate division Zixibacteria bacterium RBG_19FT_COMBO_42_43]
MSSRRKCRELVLKTLYASEIREINWEELLAQILEQSKVNPKDKLFIQSLIKQILEHGEKIAELIKEKLEHWDFKRLNSVDRIILRMGVCEMLYFPDIPIKVSIDEAIELAKKFSSPEGGKFVNGILDAIAKSNKEILAK